ncbi:MAG: ATP-binding protein [Gallionella sp.]|nr:ATP-binding protein [Gallionella sp.]
MTIKELPNCLASIRINTKEDLVDASNLATQLLKKTKSKMDHATYELSKDMFVGVALHLCYTQKNVSYQDMLNFLTDPLWCSTKQMLVNLWNCDKSFLQQDAALWHKGFTVKTQHLSYDRISGLVKSFHAQWTQAFELSKPITRKKARFPSRVQIFKQEEVANALSRMSEVRADIRVGGDVLLENAKLNDGFRTVPDAQQAWMKLETAKSSFENLIEPISRLQMDLLLAGAMKPESFHITPILLLGDPGIGKTHLATQLGNALRVPMEKISAGGAQGGFQLTGSHTSWTGARPGSIASVLAKGESAAPIIVIDELDKIVDDRYPVLPVLLDLFEPDTAKDFKDEFLEMRFDASRVIFVLTANSLDGVPTSLLSRLEVFDVPRPEPEQRLRIIHGEAARLRLDTKRDIELEEGGSETLAERIDLDLRKTTRLVREAFSKAIGAGDKVAKLIIPNVAVQRRMGF